MSDDRISKERDALKARVKVLEDRLELTATNMAGESVTTNIGECDGISCRDETIKLLVEKVQRLEKARVQWMKCAVRLPPKGGWYFAKKSPDPGYPDDPNMYVCWLDPAEPFDGVIAWLENVPEFVP